MSQAYSCAEPARSAERELNVAFIVGCPRSGTSILGELLAAHPRVRYAFEPEQQLWCAAGTGVDGSHRLTAEHATEPLRRRIRAWFALQHEPGQLVLEKTPRNAVRIPFLRAVLPEATFIHIVRDGRDVACSLMPGIGANDWNHVKPPSWQRFFREDQGIVRCARAWRETVEIALADLADAPHLQVRYEQFLADPTRIASDILAFLGLPYDRAVEAFCANVQDATADSYHARGQVQWFRKDHRRRVGRWTENLAPPQQAAVQAAIGDLLARLGYS